MSSFEPSRMPAWLAPVWEERSGSHSVSRCEPSREPARHRRRVAVPHRAAKHGQREPVDLEEDDPRQVGLLDRAPWRRAIRRATRSVYVSSSLRPEDDVEDDADRRDDERREERPPEVVDADDAVGQLRRSQQHERIRDEDEQEAGDERERQPEGCQEGRHDRVQHRQDRRHDECSPEVVDVDAGNDPGRDQQRDRVDEPGNKDLQRAQPGHLGPPGRALTVGWSRVSHRLRPRHRRDVARSSLPCRNGSGCVQCQRALPASPPASPRAALSGRRP